MRSLHLFAVVISFAFWPTASWAAELAKIDRTIKKEPAYQSKTPKYCLLVFGPEVTTRVWLVQDGDTLYVDRNGNGDLTEAGEKVAAKKGEWTDAREGVFYFEAGDIRDGKQVHKNLLVVVRRIDSLADQDPLLKAALAKDPTRRGYMVGAELEMPGWHGKRVDGRINQMTFLNDPGSYLSFSDQPRRAPIIHLGGPWQVTLFGKPRLTVGRETDLIVAVGSAGLGAGTTAYVGYEGIVPRNAYPRVEIVYAPLRASETPAKALYELKHRC